MADYPTLVPDAQYQADQQSQFQKYASQLGSPVDKYLQDQQNKFQAVASGLTAKLNDTMQNVQTKAQQAVQSAQPAAGDIAGWRNVIASQLPEQYRDNADLVNTILAGGMAESGLNPTRMQQGGNGVGFWQFDTGGGMGTGVPLDQLKDEAYQASRIIPQYIQSWENAPAGLSPAEKASWVAAQAERPYDYTNPASTARRNYANAYDVVTGNTSGGSPYQGAASVAADEGANRGAGPSAGTADQSPLAQFQAFAASLGDPVDNALAKAKAQLQQDSQGAVQTAQTAASDVGNTVDQARQTANNLLGQGVVDTLHLGSPQSTAGQAIPQTPLSTQPTEYAPDGTTPDQNLPPQSGPTVGSVLSTVGRIAALPAELGRAGFPDVTAPSSLSPGQRIAQAWEATAGQPLGERILQTGEQASAPFQHDLAANAQFDPTGGFVAGPTNTIASLGTDPTVLYGGPLSKGTLAGTGAGGLAGAGYSLATHATPEQTTADIQTGANLGMLAGGVAEIGAHAAGVNLENLSKPSQYELAMQGGAAPTPEEANLSTAKAGWDQLNTLANSLGEDLGFHNEVLKEELADIPNATGTAEGTPEYNAAVAKVYQDYSRSVAQDLRSTVGQKLAEVTTQRDALQETIDPQMQDLARKLIDPNTQNLRQVPLTQWRRMGFSDPKANALVKENGVVYVRPEYAMDTVAQEAGFDGTNAFEAALNQTRQQMGQLNDLKNQAKSLAQTNDKLDQIFQGTIPETAPKSGNISLPERAQRFLEQAKGTPEQQAALRPTEAGDAANILLKKFPAEVQPYIQDAANQFGQFAGQRRGVISDAQALENAKAIAKNGLGMSVEDFLKTKPGKAFNQEEAIALGQTMTKYGKDLDSLTQQVKVARANGTVTPELEAQVADKALEFAALSGVRSGAAAEAGRALRSFRQELSGEFSVRARAFGKAAKSFGVNPADLAKQEKPTTAPSVGGTAGTMSGPTRTLTDAERQALFEDLRSGGQGQLMGNFPQLTDLERAELFRDLQSGGQPRLLGGESKPLTDEERALLFQDLRSGGQSKLFGKFAQLSEADRQSLFPGVERTPDQPTLPGTSQATERTPLTDDERAALMADLHSGGQAPMMGNVDQLTDEERARLFPGVERTPDQPSLPGANPEVARTPEQEAALVGARADMAALNDAEQAQAPINAAANPMGTTREQQINAAFKAIGTNADQFRQWITAWETTPANDLVGRYKLLQALYKPSLIDKALALATANMLSSPKTLMVVASHGAVQTLNRPLIEALRGSPSEAMTDLTAMGHAIGQAWANAGQALLEGVGPTQAAARLRESSLDVRPEAFPGKQGLLFTPSLRAINAAHEFYRTLSTAGALAVAARREAAATGRSMEDLLKEPTPSMLEYATKAAEDAVSGGEASPFAKILLKGRSLVHQEGTANKATGLAFYALTPFVRIPDYLFRNGAKILAGPVAYPIAAGVKLAKGDAAGAAGDMKVWGLVTALDTAIYAEAAAGNITGGGPTDPHKLRALQEANGPDGQPLWQAHSIRIGGRWYDYTTMGGPLSVPLSAIASAVEEYRAEQGQGKPIGLDFAGKVADHTAQALMDTSYIKTVGDIFKSIAEGRPTAAFSRVGADVAERMVPYGGALALGARTIDQNAKAPEPSGLPVVGDIPERVEARLPFLSRNVPNQVGVFGEPLRQPQDVLSTASPALTSAAGQYNPAAAEVARLNQAGYAVPLRVFSATEQEKGGNYLGQQQTGAQMRALQTTYGQAAQAYITEVMNRPDYAKMSDAQKAATIKEALKGADSVGALQGAQSATLDPAHQAIVAWESTPHYLGVKGTPEQVRIQNYAIAQAKLKLSAYEKQYGQDLGAARLLRDDRKAYILSERPMLDATYLRLKKAEIDKQYSVKPGSKSAGALGAGHTVPSSITNQATTSQPALPPMPVVQRGSVPVGSGR